MTNQHRPQIDFSVEMAPSRKALLRLHIKDRQFPLEISGDQAGRLGIALLTASAACKAPSLPAEGTPIENCHFPVLKCATAISNANGRPLLVLTLAGENQLVLQFDAKHAGLCGDSLKAAAASGNVRSGPLKTE